MQNNYSITPAYFRSGYAVNVAAGFDILGFALGHSGDEILLRNARSRGFTF